MLIMKSSFGRNDDINRLVNIFTDDFSISIPRSVLVESSHFFKAALQSGMSESRSGEFFLSEFSPRQLQHLQHFLSDNDLFTSKVEPLQSEGGQSISSDCQMEEQVRRLVEAAFIADYLQMPRFKSKLQTLFKYLIQSLTHPQSPCFLRFHDCNTFTEMILILSDNRLKCLKKPLLRLIYRCPTVLLDSKFVHFDTSQPFLITSVLQTLSSDKIFLYNEDEILNSACEWIEHSLTPPKQCRSGNDTITEILLSLVHSLRLGLLSPSGLQHLVNLLNEHLQHVALDATLSHCLSSTRMLLSQNLRSHFQAALSASLMRPSPFHTAAFRPRADVPTLVLVARQNSPSSFILYFLNLLTGQVLSSPTPLSVERTLLFEPSESNPIHLCTAEAASCQNLVFLFIHQINTATLKGMVWDLATLQAEWMPDLDLKHASFAWASTSFSTFSLPHAVGVVYTADGLMVYCSFTLCTQTVLCVYRFDAPSWRWIKYHPKAVEQSSAAGHKVLKPMSHATAQGVGERWLYGTLDSAEGSQFIRIRPAAAPGSGDYSVQVQTLPSPDFILRAYNLVSVHTFAAGDDGDGGTGRAAFTFPFNACQRDSQAMRMCYSQTQNAWNSWEPTASSPALTASPSSSSSSLSPTTSFLSSSTEPLRFALSRNHIGFRGVVCTSGLAIPRHRRSVGNEEEGELEEGSENDIDVEIEEESSGTAEDRTSFLHPGAYFVMAGRLSQSVSPPSPKVSGLWLLDPWAARAASDAREPTFPLPPDLDGLLHRATAVCGAVGLANWTGLRAAVTCCCGGQETQTARPPPSSQSLLLPSIMRFARPLAENVGGGSGGLSSLSASAAKLFAFHHRNSGAGSDSD
uniref:BTB:POZ domain containing protein n=2 Tax=Echinococcus granulosus TaxID=6210 RepID=A0A068WPH6_ECHGR|nr:BTB:POZ domain containing protein [Echinococcus granulosus]